MVGFLPTDNGQSCEHHPYECSNSWIYESRYHGVGMQIFLQLVDGSHLTGYTAQVFGMTVAMFVLQRGSMLWGEVESGLMAVFFESGRRFSLMMRTPASELCFITTEDM